MLLTPYCEFAVGHYLRAQYALQSLVESLLCPLAHGLVGQFAAVRLLLLRYVAQQPHGVDHRTVVICYLQLIPPGRGPELRPSAVGILSAEQILHTTAESLSVTLVARALVEPRQIHHLRGGGVVVDGGVVKTCLVMLHLVALLFAERLRHVDILRPSARHALVLQHLVAYAARLVRKVELLTLLSHGF